MFETCAGVASSSFSTADSVTLPEALRVVVALGAAFFRVALGAVFFGGDLGSASLVARVARVVRVAVPRGSSAVWTGVDVVALPEGLRAAVLLAAGFLGDSGGATLVARVARVVRVAAAWGTSMGFAAGSLDPLTEGLRAARAAGSLGVAVAFAVRAAGLVVAAFGFFASGASAAGASALRFEERVAGMLIVVVCVQLRDVVCGFAGRAVVVQCAESQVWCRVDGDRQLR